MKQQVPVVRSQFYVGTLTLIQQQLHCESGESVFSQRSEIRPQKGEKKPVGLNKTKCTDLVCPPETCETWKQRHEQENLVMRRRPFDLLGGSIRTKKKKKLANRGGVCACGCEGVRQITRASKTVRGRADALQGCECFSSLEWLCLRAGGRTFSRNVPVRKLPGRARRGKEKALQSSASLRQWHLKRDSAVTSGAAEADANRFFNKTGFKIHFWVPSLLCIVSQPLLTPKQSDGFQR